MPQELRTITSAGSTIQFSNGTTLKFPDAARASQWVHAGRQVFRLPADEDANPQFDAALDEIGIVPQETIHLDVSAARGRASGTAADTVVLRPAPPRGNVKSVQVVLYSDESGGLSWHFPDGFLDNRSPTPPSLIREFRSPRQAEFTIPARTAVAQKNSKPVSELRGIVTKLGRKVFKVLVVPITAPILRKPVKWLADKVESKYKQDLIREVTPDNFQVRVTTPFKAWKNLDGHRALLIIHGIFSSTEGVLSLLPRAEMQDLYQRYQGRVISFDHLTVTRSPEENARFFLEQTRKQRGRFEFDVLTHSRGGIVTRALTEHGHQLVPGHNCQFRKAYMVAVPNQGSPLGDRRHMLEMIDVFTNVLAEFPDGWVTYSIEVILGIVKLLGYTGQIALPGIAAMGTEHYIRDTLNANRTPCPTEYAAAASNYQPSKARDNGFFQGPFVNAIMDRVFTKDGKPLKNDLVVPCEGVYRTNGHPSFPIRDLIVYREADRVWHSGFFARQDMIQHVKEHFDIADQQIDVPEDRSFPTIDIGGLRKPPPHGATTDRITPTKKPAKKAAKRKVPRKRIQQEVVTETITVLREPQIDFHEQVRAGKKEALIVKLADVQAQTVRVDELIELLLEAGQSEIKLTVALHASGFDIDSDTAELVIKRKRDPKTEMARFQLTARDPGVEPVTREIRADFWLGNRCVGAVRHRTVVVPKKYQGHVPGDGSGSFEVLTIDNEPREDADLVIYAEGKDDSGQPPFRIKLRSTLPEMPFDGKRVGEFHLDGKDLTSYLNGIYDKQFNDFPKRQLYTTADTYLAAVEDWQRSFMRYLRAVGKSLWDRLPALFHHEYFTLMDLNRRPRSVLIHSDEMLLPWELMIPHRRNGRATNLPPLGCTHVLGRWKPGLTIKPVPQRLVVKNFCVLNPQYPNAPLPWSTEEVKRLRKLFPTVAVISPANLANVDKLVLDRTDIQLLHFSGHGNYDVNNADLNHWILEDNAELSALLFADSILIRDSKPILYMNACSVGQVGMVIGRMGGFAANCLDNGCSGVIAPYWPVADRRAMEFALELYQQLKAQRSVGEALQSLRLDHQDDPTYQAFSYFGDPCTRIAFL